MVFSNHEDCFSQETGKKPTGKFQTNETKNISKLKIMFTSFENFFQTNRFSWRKHRENDTEKRLENLGKLGPHLIKTNGEIWARSSLTRFERWDHSSTLQRSQPRKRKAQHTRALNQPLLRVSLGQQMTWTLTGLGSVGHPFTAVNQNV